MLWQSSRGGLANLSGGWRPSSRPNHTADRLQALAGELARLAPASLSRALNREISSRADGFLRGVEAYRSHPYRRPPTEAPVLWEAGSTRLVDFAGAGAPVLVIPSLINRYHVLDLLPEHSFVRYLRARGLRPLLVDWGEPGPTERDF